MGGHSEDNGVDEAGDKKEGVKAGDGDGHAGRSRRTEEEQEEEGEERGEGAEDGNGSGTDDDARPRRKAARTRQEGGDADTHGSDASEEGLGDALALCRTLLAHQLRGEDSAMKEEKGEGPGEAAAGGDAPQAAEAAEATAGAVAEIPASDPRAVLWQYTPPQRVEESVMGDLMRESEEVGIQNHQVRVLKMCIDTLKAWEEEHEMLVSSFAEAARKRASRTGLLRRNADSPGEDVFCRDALGDRPSASNLAFLLAAQSALPVDLSDKMAGVRERVAAVLQWTRRARSSLAAASEAQRQVNDLEAAQRLRGSMDCSAPAEGAATAAEALASAQDELKQRMEELQALHDEGKAAVPVRTREGVELDGWLVARGWETRARQVLDRQERVSLLELQHMCKQGASLPASAEPLVAALRRRRDDVLEWAEEARSKLEHSPSLPLADLEELLVDGKALNVECKILQTVEGEVQRGRSWKRRAVGTLSQQHLLSITAAAGLVSDAKKLRCAAEELPEIRAELKRARSWVQRFKKLHAKGNGASVPQDQTDKLLEEASSIKARAPARSRPRPYPARRCRSAH